MKKPNEFSKKIFLRKTIKIVKILLRTGTLHDASKLVKTDHSKASTTMIISSSKHFEVFVNDPDKIKILL